MKTRGLLAAGAAILLAGCATAPVDAPTEASAPLAPAAPAISAVPLPDSPAGQFVEAFLEAFNSADPLQLAAYNATYDRKTPPEEWIAFHETTGDYTPVRVTENGPNRIEVLLAPGKGDAFALNTVEVDPANPMNILTARLQPAPRPPEFAIPRLSFGELNAAMRERLDAAVADRSFSGTMLVKQKGREVFAYAGGMADRESGAPMTMDTKLRIGSANKMFTAVAILQLVEAGKLSLDGTVADYLPDYPNKDFARAVTIRQLLTHTGGAGDIFTDEYFASRLETREPADYVALFGQRAQAPETERGDYANYGFVLLGRIVETVSGEGYYDYVRQHIFEPAGMQDSGSLPESTPVAGRSKGYMRGPEGGQVDNAETLPWRGSPAGGGYTTAADAARFIEALNAGKLISPAILAEATSAQREDGWYGYGFSVEDAGAMSRWGHGGGAPGMNASIVHYPALDATVVVLINLDPPAADTEAAYYANRMPLP